jgi:uncharacterized protein YqeY
MSLLGDRLHADLNSARKAKDRDGVLLLGTILADVKNRRIELGSDPTDADVLDVLRKGIKRRRESAEMYQKGNRADLAEREHAEVLALEQYLPPQASEDEVRAAVGAAIAAGATSMGPLMGRVNPQFKGKADGSMVSRIAKEELAALK